MPGAIFIMSELARAQLSYPKVSEPSKVSRGIIGFIFFFQTRSPRIESTVEKLGTADTKAHVLEALLACSINLLIFLGSDALHPDDPGLH